MRESGCRCSLPAPWQERYDTPLQVSTWGAITLGLLFLRGGLLIFGGLILSLGIAGYFLLIWPRDREFRHAVKKIANEKRDTPIPEGMSVSQSGEIIKAVCATAVGFVLLGFGLRAFVDPHPSNRLCLIAGVIILTLTAEHWLTIRAYWQITHWESGE